MGNDSSDCGIFYVRSVNNDEANMEIGEYVPTIYGDLNSDSVIDLTDLTELSLILLKDRSIDSESKKNAADIDGDGEITVADLARLKQYVSNQIKSLR